MASVKTISFASRSSKVSLSNILTFLADWTHRSMSVLPEIVKLDDELGCCWINRCRRVLRSSCGICILVHKISNNYRAHRVGEVLLYLQNWQIWKNSQSNSQTYRRPFPVCLSWIEPSIEFLQSKIKVTSFTHIILQLLLLLSTASLFLPTF